MHLLQSSIGGRAVLFADPALYERGVFDAAPQAIESEDVYEFSQDLMRLGQGITGVAVVGHDCLPIVGDDFFQAERVPVVDVRAVQRNALVAPAPPGSRRFFVFDAPGAPGFQFALSMNQVLEVTRSLPKASLHFEYSHIVAIAVWRGEPIPVVDLAYAARLGAIRLDSQWSGRLLVVRNRHNRAFALAAGGLVRQPAASSQVYAPDSISVRPMRGIRGVFRFEGSPLLVPDLDALMD